MTITITLAPSEAHLLLAVLDEARKGQAFPISVYGAAGELQIGDMFGRINEALRALRNPPVDDDRADERQRLAELDLVIVKTLAASVRARHEAARIRGERPVCCASGDGPCRPRYLVPRAHALEVVAADPDWTEILRDATEADLDVYDVREEVPQWPGMK